MAVVSLTSVLDSARAAASVTAGIAGAHKTAGDTAAAAAAPPAPPARPAAGEKG